ncbi:FAD-dependent oxidoreductase [Cereibacter changlensis JA139]|uniref:FAD-dependent oxidoreductase n=2 Tax=Cereibacter changlensis TaxID=402884 RepID=A0A2T4JZN1_9RHOB|nr:FAD-binding oxidoreductase [Cereibacter changlensis]PTE23385.1 FAD-dependent oxidoreductase [Cereibacter changlensis JA139]PZX49767.1 YD repeat-containing protein [Cereibacter changlensis]
MTRFSHFDATLWYATAAPPAPTEPLRDAVEADVCIVGGGYAGLTTALELAKAGTRAVLLEREEIGFGGSGRNAGHCTPTFTHYSLGELRSILGAPWAERLIRRQTRANDRAGQMIRDYQISCEWVQNGYVMGALRPNQIAALTEKAQSYNAVGARTRVLDRDEVAEVTGSPRFYGGWLHEEAGHLNPLGYARGLARAVMQEGGVIHTRSAVTGCARRGAGWEVTTAEGRVRAERVIFTTGAYTVGGWPRLEESFRIQRVFVAATQPLDPETRAAVLPRNTTIHDGRGDIFVYKYDAEGRIVASMFPMGRRGGDLAYTRQVMADRLRWLHPQIGEQIRWDYLWFGELDMQQRTVPRLYGLAPGVVALTGLSGRGVPTGTMLGGILSDWALGMPEADLDLRVEPLHRAPLWMSVVPALKLRQMRLSDNLAARRSGAPLPPHA